MVMTEAMSPVLVIFSGRVGWIIESYTVDEELLAVITAA